MNRRAKQVLKLVREIEQNPEQLNSKDWDHIALALGALVRLRYEYTKENFVKRS